MKRVQSFIPPSTQIKLIWFKKQTVKVMVNAVENNFLKKIRVTTLLAIKSSPSIKKIKSQ